MTAIDGQTDYDLERRVRPVLGTRKLETEKYQVWKFSEGFTWLRKHGEYNTAEQAIQEAKRMTESSSKYWTDDSIPEVYSAFDPMGRHIPKDSNGGKPNDIN